MIRRFPTVLAVSSAVLVLAGWCPLVCADGISSSGSASYELTIRGGLPSPAANASGPQVIAEVVPPGGVVPPTLPNNTQGSPLTILPDSHGFDPNNLVVGLKDNTNPSAQLLGLAFNNGGFAANGLLHFSLSIDKALSTPPQLESLTPGVSITADPPPSSSSNAVVTAPATNTPEPLSILVWSSLGGLGLVRARTIRKSRRPSA